MITDAFFDVVYGILLKLLQILPQSSPVPAAAHEAAQALGGYLNAFSPIVPLDTLYTAASIIITVEVIIFSFRFARWIASHIPFIGSVFR